MVEHGGPINMAWWQGHIFELAQNDRVLQFASLSFDATVSEILATLLSGAALVLCQRRVTQDTQLLEQFLNHHQITVATLPPVVLALLKEDELPYLTTLISAGEACPPAIAQVLAPERRFINAYGPTEYSCLLYTSPSPRDATLSRMPSSA